MLTGPTLLLMGDGLLGKYPMKVAFRVDSSLEIGTGHVMRCLALADSIRRLGCKCIFLSRDLPGSSIETINDKGFELITLPKVNDNNKAEAKEGEVAHASWLGVHWSRDVTDCLNAIGSSKVDCLIVDHYALNVKWEKSIRSRCNRLLVIDDLADRRHDCDVLIDQNLGRSNHDYDALIPRASQKLIGPKYALLRPEFHNWRVKSLNRRGKCTVRKLIISMGGVDKDNSTSAVLEALKRCNLPDQVSIKVILGLKAPYLKEVKALLKTMGYDSELLVNINDMAKVMSDADIAIGTPGSTSWERCCLGLPSFLVVTADNQISVGKALDCYGAAVLIGSINNIATSLPEKLKLHFENPELLDEMAKKAASICDGLGIKRITDEAFSC